MSGLTLRKAQPGELADLPLLSAPLLPRVNLLPPEIELRRRFRRVKTGLVGAAAASVGLVGLLYAGATHDVAQAQADLDRESTTTAQLATQATAYRDVTTVYTRAASAQAMLTQAMGTEVRWSRLLDDLSLTVPDNVWVKSVTFTQTPPAGAGAAATGTTAGAAAATTAGGTAATTAGTAAIGSATFTGVGFGHDDVAVWLESLAGQKGYADPYFSSATESLLGARKVVTFSSTATVTEAALSGRYTNRPGG